MTAAEVYAPAMAHRSDARERIAAAVHRVDTIQISPDVGRLIVHWLGGYAKLAQARYGCLPEGLADATYALAEACAAHIDSQRASIEAIPALEMSELVTVKAAAAAIGVKETTVRWHYKRGNLAGRKVGQTLMINEQSLAEFRANREEI
jgi:hypothetical protein